MLLVNYHAYRKNGKCHHDLKLKRLPKRKITVRFIYFEIYLDIRTILIYD